MANVLHIDYETRSEADLEDLGAYRYACDPSTKILMLGISLNDEDPQMLYPQWVLDAFGIVQDEVALGWAQLMADPETVVMAHNAGFEIAISRYCLERDLGVRPPALTQWRCTAAMARRAGLPASLEALGRVLGLSEQKDALGKKLIKLFCMLQKQGKKYKGRMVEPWEEPDSWWQFAGYCLQDVRTEREAGNKLSAFALTGEALLTWQADCWVNDRGVPVAVEALRATQAIITEAQQDIGAQFRELTGLNYTQRDKVLEWFEARGYREGDMKAVSVTRSLEKRDWAADELTLHALELKQDLSFSAVNKVQTMLDCDCGDGLVRGTLLWHGAGTGRWAGKLIQPQNFKRPTFRDTLQAYAMICDGTIKTCSDMELLFGTPLDVIASCIRHYIQLPGGQTMYDADYSAVEARIVCWLAGQLDALERFRKYDETGSKEFDSYVIMAAKIFARDWSEVDKDQRWLGKQTVLGCGFQMAAPKFHKQCVEKAEAYGIKGINVSIQLAEASVTAFREQYSKVKSLWYDVDRCARNAILNPGKVYRAGQYLRFGVVQSNGVPFLVMRLPAGRSIVYPWPAIGAYRDRTDCITFYGKLPGKSNQWGRVPTYGGKLVENATQGTAGDLMGHGLVTAIERGFDVFMLVHDEALAVNDGRPVEEFCDAITDLPNWAAGLPLKAEGKVIPFYLKL